MMNKKIKKTSKHLLTCAVLGILLAGSTYMLSAGAATYTDGTEINASDVTEESAVSGTLTFIGTGTLNYKITGGTVVVTVNANVTFNALVSSNILTSKSSQSEPASLTTNADYIGGSVNCYRGTQLKLTGGALTKSIRLRSNNHQELYISGDVVMGAGGSILLNARGDDTSGDNKHITIDSGASLKMGAGAVTFNDANNDFINNGTLILQDGTIHTNIIIDGTGSGIIEGNVTTKIDQLAYSGSTTINAGGNLILTSGILDSNAFINGLFNNGTISLQGATLESKRVTSGTLKILQNLTANASYFADTATNIVDTGVTLILNGNTTLGGKLDGAGDIVINGVVSSNAEYLNNTGTRTVNANSTLTLNAGMLGKDIINNGTVNLTGITGMTATVSGGILNVQQNLETSAVYIKGNTNTVDFGKTITLTSGVLDKKITNAGTVILNGIEALSARISGGTLNVQQNLTTSADYTKGDTNTVAAGAILNLNAGTLDKEFDNSGTIILSGITAMNVPVNGGNLKIQQDLTTSADNIKGDTNTVESGNTLVFVAGTLDKDITNYGTLKTVGDITINSKIEGTGTLVVESGTLQYTNTTAESITNNVEIKAGATLDPDAGVFAAGTTVTNYGTLEITGGTLTATIDGKGGDNLVMKGRMEIGTGGTVKQSADSNITVEASLIESESNDPSKAMFGGIDNADKLDVSNGNLTINGRITKDKYYALVAGSAVSGGTVTGATLWKLENIDFPGFLLVDYDVNATGGSIALYINCATSKEEAYTSGLAAVQQGNITAAKEFTEETEKHLGLAYRGAIKDTGKYDKEVWANIIHTKEKTEGMDLGAGIENNNTAQYNGTVVGTDFYTSKKAITGMAIGYIDGNINSQSGSTSTRNEAKYYGVSLYNRVTNGNTALIYDAAYIRGDNDIRQHSNGQEVTADAKTDTYIAGVRYETEVELGRSKLVPFASFRYMRVNNRDYSNSNNTKFETDNQNLYIPKAGIAWTGEFIMPQSAWTWRPHIEGGYMWNLGDRSVASDVWCGSKLANIEYDTTDKGSYYVKAGMEFICKNLTAGVFYRYLKGDAVRNNRWNLNVNWSF